MPATHGKIVFPQFGKPANMAHALLFVCFNQHSLPFVVAWRVRFMANQPANSEIRHA
jgi:hypothetical protein